MLCTVRAASGSSHAIPRSTLRATLSSPQAGPPHVARALVLVPALSSVGRITALTSDNLNLGRGDKLAPAAVSVIERCTSGGRGTYEDPVPSMRNWGSLTTNVQTSSQRRYVERWPWIYQCGVWGVVVWEALARSPLVVHTLTVVFCLTPFWRHSVNDLSNCSVSPSYAPRGRTCCSTRMASWGGMSPEVISSSSESVRAVPILPES